MSTIGNTITHGVTLATAGTYASPLTITTSGLIDVPPYGNGIYGGPSGGPWQVVNFGTISASLFGVYFMGAGFVNNKGGIITGKDGIALSGTSGTIANSGTVVGTKYVGIFLSSGTINNTSGLIIGARDGIDTQGAVTVTNSSTIASAGSFQLDAGIYLGAGGMITNEATGLLSGPLGIFSSLHGGTIINVGTILGGIELYGSPGGSVSNSGTIDGGIGVNIHGYGSVTNVGTIVGSLSYGILITFGGTISNTGTAALISGLSGGVSVILHAGTVVNSGTITTNSGTNATAVWLHNGGSVINTGNIAAQGTSAEGIGMSAGGYISNGPTGVIIGYASAINISDGAGVVVNSGTIKTVGINVSGAFAVSSYGGSVLNTSSGLIAGANGVGMFSMSGVVTNAGTIVGTANAGEGVGLGSGNLTNLSSGLITAYRGVFDGGEGTLDNSGTIVGTHRYGIGLYSGDIANMSGGLIDGYGGGVVVFHDQGTVINAGSIVGNGSAGISLDLGGAVLNDFGASIEGFDGVLADVAPGQESATVTNAGVIEATGSSGVGVDLLVGGTVINSGTIVGLSSALSFGGRFNDLLVLQTGYVVVGAVDGSGTAGATNTLELDGSIGSPLSVNYNALDLLNFQDVEFGAGGANTLKVSNTLGTLPTTISGFTQSSDIIDLTAIGTNGSITSQTANEVTIAGTLGSLTVLLDGSDSVAFTTTSDGGTGTDLRPACFVRGTLILTPAGEVPVEELAIDDQVITASRVPRRIKWIGRRSYAPRFAWRQKHLLPVCVKAGALAEDIPKRDLYISPNHALYLEGALIEVGDLIDGASVVQLASVEEPIEYFHLELDRHDLIIAERTIVESYIDDDNRNLFHNADEYRALYPEHPGVPARYCAPRRAEGFAVENARSLIAGRTRLVLHSTVGDRR
jgi:Hint domain